VGIHLVREERAAAGLLQMAAESSAETRASAAWALGHWDHPAAAEKLQQMKEAPEPIVRRNAERALIESSLRRTAQTLKASAAQE